MVISRQAVRELKGDARGVNEVVSFDCLSNFFEGVLDLAAPHVGVGEMETGVARDIHELTIPNDGVLGEVVGGGVREGLRVCLDQLVKDVFHLAFSSCSAGPDGGRREVREGEGWEGELTFHNHCKP
jgi:hypothetical protein